LKYKQPDTFWQQKSVNLWNSLFKTIQEALQMQTDFITTKQAAALLGYHQIYLTKLVREGKIPGYKRGQWRISKSELLAFIEAGSNQPEKLEAE
jgi:excisionase family DNA binding protein